MRKTNTKDIVEVNWTSPKGTFAGAGKEISEALGRKPQSTNINETASTLTLRSGVSRREKISLPPIIRTARRGSFTTSFPSKGTVRHKDGTTAIETGRRIHFQTRRNRAII